mmetsp:Transcript_47/g.68  ORF Transcript_47/g.68 Transcript_47/m.68 type:complete len:499 (-) Transcript_47:142-1638(-)|eukprot:CAMPEP_0196593126 /NCGR_PEP_ID=MMETSP1081-20130531/74749_1 /TAXON_ID=36882 /ORGANISM="Pyramimonas amylifera, Strain CCMP720" /LENGTH=498 /DNA_ID=CAMNT_0041917013 /DNA_START=65 /DNA_END=1561 /DNA_ORIENTATION=+
MWKTLIDDRVLSSANFPARSIKTYGVQDQGSKYHVAKVSLCKPNTVCHNEFRPVSLKSHAFSKFKNLTAGKLLSGMKSFNPLGTNLVCTKQTTYSQASDSQNSFETALSDVEQPNFSIEENFYDWKDGHQICYSRLRSNAAKDVSHQLPPVVFLPGFGVGAFHFRDVMFELGRLGVDREVYALDWFGQGKSWPTRDPAPSASPSSELGFQWGFGQQASPGYEDLVYSIENWTSQLEHFLSHELPARSGSSGFSAVLAGNSLGGLIATNLGSKRQDLVEGLVLLNATPFWGFNKNYVPIWKGGVGIPKVIQSVAALWWNSIRTTKTITTMLDLVYASPNYDKSIIAEIQEPTKHPGAAAAFCSILFSPPPDRTFEQMCAELKAPVLLCYGRDDPWVVPAWGQKIKREMPTDQVLYYEISPSGHCPHHETPEPVAHTIRAFCRALHLTEEGSSLESRMPKETITFGNVTVDYLSKGSPRNIFEKLTYGAYCIEKYVLKLK